ncbi:MAG: hypothetical protein EOR11_19995 [Mesorhizobium sp.]|uniref:hypothetical protein n=1 Tax=Mesorhizobium sp. TaxID=1871066 RepID=UPI000FE62AAB|nr:hypothetical protein [Mesorhizobium sp.]RWP84744.1 MAG: hypothetical protein EOR11_19995 [Mesorhizobium sp.]
MLTDILAYILVAYGTLAFVAFLHMLVSQSLPQWFDRATAYGDGKLNWWERLTLLIWAPAIIAFVVYWDKWPGIKSYLPELWVMIVLGRQPSVKDTM